MSLTASGPVNPSQLIAALGGGVVRVDGDPTQPGAVLSSSQYTDDQISAALGAIVYDPNFGARAEAAAVVTQLAAAIPEHIAQAQTDAAAIASIQPGQALTAEQISAMTNHANGWVTLLQGLGALLTAQGLG